AREGRPAGCTAVVHALNAGWRSLAIYDPSARRGQSTVVTRRKTDRFFEWRNLRRIGQAARNSASAPAGACETTGCIADSYTWSIASIFTRTRERRARNHTRRVSVE